MIRRRIGHCDRKRRSRACREPTTLSRKTCIGARERIREVVDPAIALEAIGGISGRRRSDPRGGLQRRAPRTARGEPGGRSTRDEPADARSPRRDTTSRQRPRAARRVSRHRRGDPRGSRHHSGRRVAGRQLPHRRRPDPRDPRRSPARLLSAAAQALGRSPRGLSARLGAGMGLRRAHGQPLRSADPLPVRARLSARAAAHDRRAVGRRDHAADRARREPAAGCRADRQQSSRARGSRCPGRPPAGRRRPRGVARGQRPAASRAGNLVAGVRGAAGPAPAGSRSDRDARRAVAGCAPGRPGDERRGAGPPGASAARRDERDGPKRDHQHAPDVRRRLGGALRERQPRRCDAARGQRLRGDGFSDARSLSARHRRARTPLEALGARRGSARDRGDPTREGSAARYRRRERAPRARSRLLPDLEWTPEVRAGAGIPCPAEPLARARRRARRPARLSRNAHDRHRADPRASARRARALRVRRGKALAVRAARSRPRVGSGAHARQPLRHDPGRPARATGARAARGRPVEPAHAGRRSHSLDDTSGARGADRAARDPCLGEPRRRSPFCAALGLDGLRYGARRRRRRTPRSGQRGDRSVESTPWTRAGRRPLPAAPSPAGLERRRGQVDRLGTQAGKAPRAESIAARRERHDLS